MEEFLALLALHPPVLIAATVIRHVARGYLPT